jgi:hypothetical protein
MRKWWEGEGLGHAYSWCLCQQNERLPFVPPSLPCQHMLCNLTSSCLTQGAETSCHHPCSAGMLTLKANQITQMSLRHPHYQKSCSVGISGFEICTVVAMRTSLFWYIMPCSPMKANQHCRTLIATKFHTWHVLTKCRLTSSGLHSIMSQRTELFIWV